MSSTVRTRQIHVLMKTKTTPPCTTPGWVLLEGETQRGEKKRGQSMLSREGGLQECSNGKNAERKRHSFSSYLIPVWKRKDVKWEGGKLREETGKSPAHLGEGEDRSTGALQPFRDFMRKKGNNPVGLHG